MALAPVSASDAVATAALPLGALIVPLLRGVVYADEKPRIYTALLRQLAAVRDYLKVLGLAVHVDEAEGFVFLRQQLEDTDGSEGLEADAAGADATVVPRLLARRPLSYAQSLLCLVLRRRLLEHDLGDSSPRLVLEAAPLIAEVNALLPAVSNEAKRIDALSRALERLVDFGLLKALKPGLYEVRRVLKALVDASWLERFESLLETYAEQL